MKRSVLVLAFLVALSSIADAKGGFSSGGGGRSSGGFSGARGGFSSAPAPRPAPAQAAPRPAPAQAAQAAQAQRPAQAAPQQRTTTTITTSTTVNRSSSYGGRYVSPGGYYGGWGMGYGYNNGLLTGIIIANMMHPYGTVMYAGPGMYSNNAVLYTDGRVVNQQGVLVGYYQNGVFTPVANGSVVAQQVPADAMGNGTYQSSTQAQPVAIVRTGPSGLEIFGSVMLGILCVILIIVIIAGL